MELLSTDTVTLQWESVTGANYYYVYIWDSSGQEPDSPTATVVGTSYTATGLTANTQYSWRIVSASPFVEASGCGSRSFMTLGAPACPVLTFPDNGSPLDDPTQVTLTWAAPSDATSYKVYVWVDGQSQPATPTATTTDTFYLASGLAADTTYRWLIDAVNTVGDSVGCGSRTFTTAAVPPLCPVITAPTNGGLLDTQTTVTLDWNASSTATSYNVYVWADGESQPGTPTYTTSNTYYDVTGLTANTLYNWKVTAVNGVGESSGCSSYTFMTKTDVFGALVYNSTTNTGLTFTWNSESYDYNDWHDTSSNTSKLTVVPDVSLVRVAFGIRAEAVSDIGVYVYQNNAAFYGMPSGGYRSGGAVSGSAGSAPISVSEGDAFTLTGTATLGGGQASWFSIERMDPTTKYALVRLSNSIAFSTRQTIVIPWQSEVVDTDNFWTVSDPTKLTVPSGMTLVQVRANSSHGSAYDQIVAYILKNGGTFVGYPHHHQTSNYKDSVPVVSAVVEVSPGDYFTHVILREDSGTMLANQESWFSIQEIPSSYKRVLAHKTASQSISANVSTKIQFQTEIYDTDGMFNSASSTTDFVIPSGVTRAKVCYNIETPNVGYRFQSRAYLNDQIVAGLPSCDTDTIATDWMNADGAWIDVVPGDVLTLTLTSTGGITLTSSNATWMCVLCQ